MSPLYLATKNTKIAKKIESEEEDVVFTSCFGCFPKTRSEELG